MRRIHYLMAAAAAGLLLMASCSSDRPATRRNLSEHERDSVLARQHLPGAIVVGRALKARVQAETRAADVDAKLDSLPH